MRDGSVFFIVYYYYQLLILNKNEKLCTLSNREILESMQNAYLIYNQKLIINGNSQQNWKISLNTNIASYLWPSFEFLWYISVKSSFPKLNFLANSFLSLNREMAMSQSTMFVYFGRHKSSGKNTKSIAFHSLACTCVYVRLCDWLLFMCWFILVSCQ